MRKILFWAAGENARDIFSCIKEEVHVEAFVENNSLRWGELFCGCEIIPYSRMQEFDYEYIVITTPNYSRILEQLADLGINEKIIITPFAPERCGMQGWRDIFHVGELLYYISNQRMLRMKEKLDNMEYEIVDEVRRNNLKYPIIRTKEETVQKLKDGYSMSRYGDGELNMILGRNFSTFQVSDNKLIERLAEILKSNLDKHIVCLPDVYGSMSDRNEEHKEWFRRHLANGGRQADYQLFDLKKIYYNAFVTRPYMDIVDKSNIGLEFEKFKAVWDNRDITIIEGEKTRFGVGNDLLDNAKSVERILCPAVDAFGCYDRILAEAKKIDKKRLVLIALGQTATVLAYDLAKEGFQALDIGHLDIEYEWYLRGTQVKIPIDNKFVNEAPLGRNVSDKIDDKKYNSQIIARIG